MKTDKCAGKTLSPSDLLKYQTGAIVSQEIVEKGGGTVTLFAFDKGQGLSEHTAPFDALVYIVDGRAEIRISGKASYEEKPGTISGTENTIYIASDGTISGFRFSDQSTSPEPTFPATIGDFMVANGTFYTKSGVLMQDMGFKSITAVHSVPTDGYNFSGPGNFITWQSGHCYAFRLGDGNYGVI